MKGLIGAPRELAVDDDEIAWPRRFAGDDDLILPQTAFDRERRRLDGREHHAFVDDFLGRPAEIAIRVLLHLRDDELLVERAAVDPDAHRLRVVDGDLANGRELLVASLSRPDVARVDSIFIERARAVRVSRQQQVTVVMEVADERSGAAGLEHPLFDLGNRSGRIRQVDGHTHELGSGFGELDALLRRGARVGRIGHRHRLHDDRRTAANLDVTDLHAHSPVKPHLWHRSSHVSIVGRSLG